MSQRADRVGHLIQQELSQLLRELKDPRVQQATLVTLTHVRVSDDLGVARVLLSVIDPKPLDVIRAVGRAQRFLQGQLLRRLSAKKVPELRFYLDETEDKAGHIDELLREVRAEPPVGASSDGEVQDEANDVRPDAGAEAAPAEGKSLAGPDVSPSDGNAR